MQRRPKVFFSLFQRKISPRGPRNLSPEAKASLLGKLAHLSALAEGTGPQPNRPKTQPASGDPKMGPWGIHGPYSYSRNVWEPTLCGGHRAGSGQIQPGFPHCPVCWDGDKRHITMSGTETFEQEVQQGKVGEGKVAGEGAALDRGARGTFLKNGASRRKDISHVEIWGRDCLMEETASAKAQAWDHAGQVPGTGKAHTAKAE